jgi:hypothetical protein
MRDRKFRRSFTSATGRFKNKRKRRRRRRRRRKKKAVVSPVAAKLFAGPWRTSI